MEDSEEIIDSICSYAERHAIKALLREYMKRVVLQRPADVKAFLIESIEREPFTPKVAETLAKPVGKGDPESNHT